MAESKKITAAYARIEAAEPALFQFGEALEAGMEAIALASAEGRTNSFTPVGAVEGIRKSLRREARNTWRGREQCESAIGSIYEREFEALDLAIGMSQECTRRLTNNRSDLVPKSVAYAVSSLAVRSQSTAHEICALLRSALVNGAQGRWRTLHEVCVVAAVLSLGNRYTAGRFNNHRWVTLARDLDHPIPGVAWRSEGPTPAVMRDRLIKRYGKPYGGRYGWASPVTKKYENVEHPSWYHLERVAELADGHKRRVKNAHHSVHADSLGTLNLIHSSGLLHAGPMLADVPELTWQTISTLHQTTDLLLAIWQRYDTDPHVHALRQILDEVMFQAELVVIDRSDERVHR